MRKVRHKNVVQFIGACTRRPNLCIVFEFMAGGSIYDYMRKVRLAFHPHRTNTCRILHSADELLHGADSAVPAACLLCRAIWTTQTSFLSVVPCKLLLQTVGHV